MSGESKEVPDAVVSQPACQLCGEPMPEGEEMFNYHGYSGPCPKPSAHASDCPCFGDSTANGEVVEHSKECRDCECEYGKSADWRTQRESVVSQPEGTSRVEMRTDHADMQPSLGEVLVENAAFVHFERMSESHYWVGIDCVDGRHVRVNIYAKRATVRMNAELEDEKTPHSIAHGGFGANEKLIAEFEDPKAASTLERFHKAKEFVEQMVEESHQPELASPTPVVTSLGSVNADSSDDGRIAATVKTDRRKSESLKLPNSPSTPVVSGQADGWIPIKDRLPDSRYVGTYLVLDDMYASVQAIWNGEVWHADFLGQTGPILELVTHWQPLPSPPSLPKAGETEQHWDTVHQLLEPWQKVWNGDREKYSDLFPAWILDAAAELFAHDICDAWAWNDYVLSAATIIARHLPNQWTCNSCEFQTTSFEESARHCNQAGHTLIPSRHTVPSMEAKRCMVCGSDDKDKREIVEQRLSGNIAFHPCTALWQGKVSQLEADKLMLRNGMDEMERRYEVVIKRDAEQVSVLAKERDAFRSSLEDFFIQRPTGRYCCCGAEGNDIHAGICDDGNLALTNYEKAQNDILNTDVAK